MSFAPGAYGSNLSYGQDAKVLHEMEHGGTWLYHEESGAIKKSPSGDLTFDGVQNTYLISPVLGSYASP